MAERHPTSRGARRCAAWLAACKKLGWPSSTMGRLCDLWWEHHDDNGDLIEPQRSTDSANADGSR